MTVAAWRLQDGYGYAPMLAIAAVAPLLALLVWQSLAPKLDAANPAAWMET